MTAKRQAAKPKAKRATTRAPTPKTCGDHGGRSYETLAPCERAAGWGTDRKTGRCKDHDEAAERAHAERKAQILETYREGTNAINEAARRVGVSVAQIWRWRQVDPAFNQAMTAAGENADAVRVGLVEDSLFRRILAGEASPAETIFFLKNRGAHRWRDKQEHEHAGPGGAAIPHTVTVAFVGKRA